MRLEHITSHISVLDLVILARKSAIDRYGVYTEVPTDPQEISDFVSRIFRRYAKALFSDCYVRKNKTSFSIRLDEPAFAEMYEMVRGVTQLGSRFYPSSEDKRRIASLYDSMQRTLAEFSQINPQARADGKLFIYMPHTTMVYDHSRHTFHGALEQIIDFRNQWHEMYNTEFVGMRDLIQTVRENYAAHLVREQQEREESEARMREQIERQERERVERERAERERREQRDRERRELLERQVREAAERAAAEAAAEAARPRVTLRPLTPGAPTVAQQYAELNPLDDEEAIDTDFFEEDEPEEQPIEWTPYATLRYDYDPGWVATTRTRTTIPAQPAPEQTVTPARRPIITPVQGTRVSDDQQNRFNDILRRVRDGHNETAVTAEAEMDRHIAEEAEIQRRVEERFSRLIRDRDSDVVRSRRDISQQLRMVPTFDVAPNQYSHILLNSYTNDYVGQQFIDEVLEELGNVRIPDEIPTVDIQFDKEYLSDVTKSNVEEAIKEGPNGIFYVPLPIYYAHVDDTITQHATFAEALESYRNLARSNDMPLVYYPVINPEPLDMDDDMIESVPYYIGESFEMFLQEFNQRSRYAQPQPF